jgi:predicted Rossmann fold nucleotide-binding protein DprA/Smf involved in DNA uptake
MRVIIAGGRNFNDYERLKSSCDKILSNQNDIQIVSGNAKGADELGERYANEKGYGLNVYPAEWEKYGKSAGYKRNVQMAENADALIAFWDGKSKGTKHMIDIAKNLNLLVRIINFIK